MSRSTDSFCFVCCGCQWAVPLIHSALCAVGVSEPFHWFILLFVQWVSLIEPFHWFILLCVLWVSMSRSTDSFCFVCSGCQWAVPLIHSALCAVGVNELFTLSTNSFCFVCSGCQWAVHTTAVHSLYCFHPGPHCQSAAAVHQWTWPKSPQLCRAWSHRSKTAQCSSRTLIWKIDVQCSKLTKLCVL